MTRRKCPRPCQCPVHEEQRRRERARWATRPKRVWTEELARKQRERRAAAKARGVHPRDAQEYSL